MKILSRQVTKHGNGDVSFIAENEEDTWLLYNLFRQGDIISGRTSRKLQNETSTGRVLTSNKTIHLGLRAETIKYDSEGGIISVKGRVCVENQFVRMGSYHTLDLRKGEKYFLHKDYWDTIDLEQLQDAADVTKQSDVAAVVLDYGIAHLCLITPAQTLLRGKVELNIPKKRKGIVQQRDKAVEQFFLQAMNLVEKHVNFDIVKCVILASPGFVKDQFYNYLMDQAVRLDKRSIIENKRCFCLIHSSSGYLNSLNEVLLSPICVSRFADTKAIKQVQMLQSFYDMMKQDASRAFYGVKHVECACESMAIDTLLISNARFRSTDLDQRRRFVRLVDDVRANQGSVYVFSSMHPSGEELDRMSGVAAILRFPIPEPESDDDKNDDDESEGGCGLTDNVKYDDGSPNKDMDQHKRHSKKFNDIDNDISQLFIK